MPDREKRETGYTLLELLFVVSIISLLIALLVPQLLAQRSRIIEIQAQKKLRTIGSVMAAYALSQEEGNYADFQDLKDARFITRDVTLSSIIVDYSLVFQTTDSGDSESSGLYTIIAYPRPERSQDRLSTFAITEDNVVRVYEPGPGVSPTNPHTWPPVL